MFAISSSLTSIRRSAGPNPRATRRPGRVSSRVGLWGGLLLLLGLAPSALAAPITLAWDAVAGATGYTIYYGTTSRTYTATVEVANTTTAALSALDPAELYYFAVTASNDAGEESDFSNEVLYTPAQPQVVWAVNAGGPAYTDAQGIVYRDGTRFSTGSAYTTSAAIAGTADERLYQSERWGNFTYGIPVANGDYRVTLKFAEIAWTQPGQRVFNVFMEGVKVLSKLDLVATVGPHTAYEVTVPVRVTDGKLSITFQAVVDDAKVSAIVVQAAGGTP